MPIKSNMARDAVPQKQKFSTKVTTAEKSVSRNATTDKYSKQSSQDKYHNKNNAGEKYSSVKSTTTDKYSSGPSGEKYSTSKKIAEDKYIKTASMDTHLKTKTSTKDTYVKGTTSSTDDSKKKSDDKTSKSWSQSSDNQKPFTSSAKSTSTDKDKRNKLFEDSGWKSTKPEGKGTWTSRDYSKEQQKYRYKDDRSRGSSALGTGAIAGVGLLAAAGPRRRNDRDKVNTRSNNDHNNRKTDPDRLERGPQYNNENQFENTGDKGCCVLL